MRYKSLIKLIDMKDMKSKFITFEGPEGSGKSSHIKLLVEYLKNKGIQVEVLREPGSTLIGEKIRQILLSPDSGKVSSLCELFLYLAARAQLIDEKIKPLIEKNKIVICDRFNDATWAYQVYAGCLPGFIIEGFNNYIREQGIEPNLTILLDVSAEIGLKRAAMLHPADRIEQKGIDFHNKVREGYLDLAKRNPDRIKIISSEGKMDDVQLKIREKVDEILK
jgi:dTMP kinase